jgi:hypothetical protein
MSGLARADGWQAWFEDKWEDGTTHRHPKDVVVWQDDGDGRVVGLVAVGQAAEVRAGGAGLRSAESYDNFLFYGEREQFGAPVAAQPGWWIVSRLGDAPEGSWWTRVSALASPA